MKTMRTILITLALLANLAHRRLSQKLDPTALKVNMTDVIIESQMYYFNDRELGLLETVDVDSTELGLEKAETFMAFLNKLVKEDILKK